MASSEEPYIRIEDGFDNSLRSKEASKGLSSGASVSALSGLTRHPLGKLLLWLTALLVLVGILVACYKELPSSDRKTYLEDLGMSSIPIVAMLFTWFHIWLAIQMMFRPIKFIGIWQLGDTGTGIGWQGVVPRKSFKIAKTAYACARPHLLSPRVLLERCDPFAMMDLSHKELLDLLEGAIRTVAERQFPGLHERMPPDVFEELTHLAAEHVAETSGDLWKKLTDILATEDGMDNDKMVVDLFTTKKEILNAFFFDIGKKEFKFIEHCGAALGFFCGCVQVVGFNYLKGPVGKAIFLPGTGFFLGIFTNWLAILVCFWPCFPHHITICGRHICNAQGLFLKRQQEAAERYSRLMTDHFFNFNYIVNYLQTQPELWERLKTTYLDHNVKVFHKALGGLKHVAPIALGRKQFEELQQDITLEIVRRVGLAEEMHSILESYMEESTDVHTDNTRSMQAMAPDEFENLLHPIFKEDEWILILLGGVLGAIVGFAQVCFLPDLQ